MVNINAYTKNKKKYLDLKQNQKDEIEINERMNLNQSYEHSQGVMQGVMQGGTYLLKNMLKDPNKNFYFTHSVANDDLTVLYAILKDGYLRPGKDIKHANIRSPGDLEYIYGNLNFSDLNNIDILNNVSLQFSPELIFDYGMIFNRGWFKYPYDTSIWIHESDTLEEKYRKLDEVKEYIKNPTFYPFKVSGYKAHEIMIDRPIPLNKYLISVNRDWNYPKKYKKMIDKIIRSKYPGVKILDCPKDEKGYTIPPSLDDIIGK